MKRNSERCWKVVFGLKQQKCQSINQLFSDLNFHCIWLFCVCVCRHVLAFDHGFGCPARVHGAAPISVDFFQINHFTLLNPQTLFWMTAA
jgi:hypothetical protein